MRFLVVDDHELVRNGLSAVLTQTYGGLEIVQAGSVADGLRTIREDGGFDLAILDMVLPDGEGTELMDELGHWHPEVPMIAVSGDSRFMDVALDRGALGFLPKSADSAELLDAIGTVLEGRVYVPRTLSALPRRVAASRQGSGAEAGPLPDLTLRQRTVLRLMMQGQSNRDISQALGLAESTVKIHVSSLLKLLKVTSRTQAVITARNLGLLD